jgi:hypothetical protein
VTFSRRPLWLSRTSCVSCGPRMYGPERGEHSLRPPRVAFPAVAALAAVAVMLTGCQSSGTHLQSAPPSTTVSAPPSSSATPSSNASTPSASTSTSQKVVQFPTPTVTPPAQDAVAAYIAATNLSAEIDRDPAHADVAKFDQYVTGDAKTQIDAVYASQKREGVAFRGTPAAPRLKVFGASPMTVTLGNCPLPSKRDPYTMYHVKTGQPVPTPTLNPPPPYQLVATMSLVDGHWKVSRIIQDPSRTCKG